jgi:GDP-L-fucose synthase
MKILVTGGKGFLGSFLVDALQQRGDEVVALSSKDADLTREGALSSYNGTQFDTIYHLAAWTQAGDFCLTHQGEQWIINQKIHTNVLSWWHEHQPQARMIALSTSCVYDSNLPLTEDNHQRGEPIESLFSYGMTKKMLHAGLISLQRQFGHRYLCFVPSTLYGENYHLDGRQMHFIFDLMRKIIRGKRYGEPVVLWGDGYQKRELVYVHDFVRAMLTLESRCENELINIGAGEEYTIRDFAQILCREIGYPFESIQFDTSKYVGARSKCLSTEKLKKIMPEFKPTPLDVGLKKTVAWFEKSV